MQVGDKVYLRPVGNNLRRGYKATDIEEYEIKKIGRKYYEVWNNNSEYSTVKFHLDNHGQVTDYSADWQIYFSKQDIIDENEFVQLEREIKRKFDGYGKVDLSLDQLRRIKAIIDEQS